MDELVTSCFARDMNEIEQLRDLIEYAPETGLLRRKVILPRGKAAEGWITGTPGKQGYKIKVSGRFYRVHRLAFALQTGAWPTHQIDHINGDPLDNRWANLRPATPAQNMRNRRCNKTSGTGFKNVSLDARYRNPFRARIRVDGRRVHIGRFPTPEEAAEAARLAAAAHYGEFAK